MLAPRGGPACMALTSRRPRGPHCSCCCSRRSSGPGSQCRSCFPSGTCCCSCLHTTGRSRAHRCSCPCCTGGKGGVAGGRHSPAVHWQGSQACGQAKTGRKRQPIPPTAQSSATIPRSSPAGAVLAWGHSAAAAADHGGALVGIVGSAPCAGGVRGDCVSGQAVHRQRLATHVLCAPWAGSLAVNTH